MASQTLVPFRGGLMPPPPPRPKRKELVLEEEEWCEKLEAIIERDFFPELSKLESKVEWLQVRAALKQGHVDEGQPLLLSPPMAAAAPTAERSAHSLGVALPHGRPSAVATLRRSGRRS